MKRIPVLAITPLFALALAACSAEPADPPALTGGDWSLDAEASHLSYVTIKVGEIAETNSFKTLSGSVSADGAAQVTIDLASVETGVDIRNERMRDVFFGVADNPTAQISAQIDPAAFKTLAIGESVRQPLEATLSVKGVEAPIATQVSITRTSEDGVLVTSVEPVIVTADALELTDGLATLQELAGLPSITPVVPVSFSIAFKR